MEHTCKDCTYCVTDYDCLHDWCNFPYTLKDELQGELVDEEIEDISKICNNFKKVENDA